jgi:hypothetical protein
MRQEQEREKAKLREMTEHEIEGYLWTFAVENWETFGWESPPKLGIFPIRPKRKKFSFNLADLHNSAKITPVRKESFHCFLAGVIPLKVDYTKVESIDTSSFDEKLAEQMEVSI